MQPTIQTRFDEIKRECWNEALHAYGLAEIFRRKQKVLDKRINFITLLGVIIPGLVGATAMGYGLKFNMLPAMIAVGIFVLIIQLLLSILALVYKWSDKMSYANESISENSRLSDDFRKLGANQAIVLPDLEQQFQILSTRSESRSQQDNKVDIEEKENRYGMRHALRIFKRKCAGCGLEPISLTPTDCDVCGNFKFSNF
ncbi:MAG: hypothetical protein M3Y54_00275 [Bacteroidota bacterium]|nr:hypothetical protein [Bacteroidota bacterium]